MALITLWSTERGVSKRSREQARPVLAFGATDLSPASQGVVDSVGRRSGGGTRRHIPVPAVPPDAPRSARCYYVALTVWANHDADIFL